MKGSGNRIVESFEYFCPIRNINGLFPIAVLKMNLHLWGIGDERLCVAGCQWFIIFWRIPCESVVVTAHPFQSGNTYHVVRLLRSSLVPDGIAGISQMT